MVWTHSGWCAQPEGWRTEAVNMNCPPCAGWYRCRYPRFAHTIWIYDVVSRHDREYLQVIRRSRRLPPAEVGVPAERHGS